MHIAIHALLLAALSSGAATEQKDDGWREVFDGKSLDGWVTRGGRYDGNANWRVEDGAITGSEGENHAGGLIYLAQPYSDFEIELDAYITHPFDSGIFVRMTPKAKGAQVTLDYRDGGEVGGIYSDGYLFHNEAGKERYKKDEWNHFRVRCTGDPMHIVTWMNGELLTDYQLPEHKGEYATSGLIGLQVHGSRDDPPGSHVKFKNIRVKNLSDFETDAHGFLTPNKAGEAKAWRALFNGKDLEGWEEMGSGGGYKAEDGVMTFLVKGGSPHIVTKEDFEDFELRLDFKISKMANSGLFLRGKRGEDNPAYSGCEMQILDDFNYETVTGSTLKKWQFTGGLYGAVAPAVSALNPLGEWNTYEVRCEGSRIRCVLNGCVLYDVDTQAEGFVVAQGPPFKERVKKGFIGLQRHAPSAVEGEAYAWFRNIWVREL